MAPMVEELNEQIQLVNLDSTNPNEDPSPSQADSDHESEFDESDRSYKPKTEKFTMNFLASLIPKKFNGNRKELNAFTINCTAAYKLASETQKIPLLYAILAKIDDPAKSQLTHLTFNNWNELKQKLRDLYLDKKHYSQLFEELNSIKQNFKETIPQYLSRLELALAEVMKEIPNIEKDPNLLPGAISSIQQIALNRFVYHCLPQFSQVLRWKKPVSLQEAYNIASEEEQALTYVSQNRKSKFENNKSSYNRHGYTHMNKYCNTCKKKGHTSSECYRNKARSYAISSTGSQTCHYCHKQGHFAAKCIKKRNEQGKFNKYSNSSSSRNSNSSNNSSRSCTYCKKDGHTMEQCYKKKNDSKKEVIAGTNTNALNCNELPSQDAQSWGSEVEILGASQ